MSARRRSTCAWASSFHGHPGRFRTHPRRGGRRRADHAVAEWPGLAALPRISQLEVTSSPSSMCWRCTARRRDAVHAALSAETGTAAPAAAEPLPRRAMPQAGIPPLTVQDLLKRFGGRRRSAASAEVKAGEIVGLIDQTAPARAHVQSHWRAEVRRGHDRFLGQDITRAGQRRIVGRHRAHLPAREAAAKHDADRQCVARTWRTRLVSGERVAA